MAFEISEGPYSIESIMESIRVQVIDAEALAHAHAASGEGNGSHLADPSINPDAPRPLVNDGTPVSALLTQIELMRQRQSIQPDYQIHSHRRFFGGIANLLKKFVFWGVRPPMELLGRKQEAFNEATLHAMRETSYQLDAIQRHMHGQHSELSARLEDFHGRLKELHENLTAQQAVLSSGFENIENQFQEANLLAWGAKQLSSDLQSQHDQLRVEHQTLVKEHWALADQISKDAQAIQDTEAMLLRRHDLTPFFALIPTERRLAAMDVTRGSYDDIWMRQKEYIELLKNRPGRIVDLGCGRGELLNMMRLEGIECWGAETDPLMIHTARDRGVHIEPVDAVTALASVPPASLGGVFSAQLIEHLFPGELLQVLRLARRQLASGGIIILETINAASPAAFSKSYTRDLDHKLPLHPEYLKLLLETAGFEQITLHYSAPFEPKERLAPLPPADKLGLSPEAHAALQERLNFLDEFLFGMQDCWVTGIQGEPTPADEPVGVPTVALNQ